nr:O-antigen ligase family protein [Sulfobacillus harzensis]
MVFPIAAALLAYGPKWVKNGWTWAALVLIALGVIDSFSRGAWVASVAAVFFMGVLAWVARGKTMINRKFVFPAVIVPILLFVVVDLLGKTNLSHHAAIISYQSTGERARSTVTALFHPKHHFDTNQRLLIWKAALNAIKSHPVLGVGLGGFHRYVVLHPVPGLVSAPPMAHNLYLEWGADLGVLGIVAALWLEWSWLKNAVSGVVTKVRKLSPFELALGIGAFGTIVSFVVHDWVDFMIDHGVIVPLLLALAAVWALNARRRSGESQ